MLKCLKNRFRELVFQEKHARKIFETIGAINNFSFSLFLISLHISEIKFNVKFLISNPFEKKN